MCGLSQGWLEFLKDCYLKEGDTCLLKMVEKACLCLILQFQEEAAKLDCVSC